MAVKNYKFTSESVSEGHPDKVADQISDAILDELLKQDINSRVALETLVTTDRIVLSGEITSAGSVDFEKIARETVANIGYTDPEIGFDAKSCEFHGYIHSQSSDISCGVTAGEGLHLEQGAGDQGMMFGFAINETENYMPMSLEYSHDLVKYLANLRKIGELNFVRPDSKSQVTVEYKNGEACRIDSIVLSTQHTPEVSLETIREAMIESVIKKVIPADLMDDKTIIHVNPTGRFVIGGPNGDTGLTGRKIIVDTYGGMARHGGGAFSGKDPSKVDRSAAYMGRYIAKNIVAAGLAKRCEIQVAYAIGVAEPVSVMVDSFGTGIIPDEEIRTLVLQNFDMRPAAIIRDLELKQPRYFKTASYGHFGRTEPEFTWENLDKVDLLKK